MRRYISYVEWKLLLPLLLVGAGGIWGFVRLSHPIWRALPLLLAAFCGSFAFFHLVIRMVDALPLRLFDSYRHHELVYNSFTSTFVSFLWLIPAASLALYVWPHLPPTLLWRVPVALLIGWLTELAFRTAVDGVSFVLVRPRPDYPETDDQKSSEGTTEDESDPLWTAALAPEISLKMARPFAIGGLAAVLVAPFVGNPYIVLVLYGLTTVAAGLWCFWLALGISQSISYYFDERLPFEYDSFGIASLGTGFLGSGLVMLATRQVLPGLLSGELLFVTIAALRLLVWLSMTVAVIGTLYLVRDIASYHFPLLKDRLFQTSPRVGFFLGFYGLYQAYRWVEVNLCKTECSSWALGAWIGLYVLAAMMGFDTVVAIMGTLLGLVRSRLGFLRYGTVYGLVNAVGAGFIFAACFKAMDTFLRPPGSWIEMPLLVLTNLALVFTLSPLGGAALLLKEDVQRKRADPAEVTVQAWRPDRIIAITMTIALGAAAFLGASHGYSVLSLELHSILITFVVFGLLPALAAPFALTAESPLRGFRSSHRLRASLGVGMALYLFAYYHGESLEYRFLTAINPTWLYVLALLLYLGAAFGVHLFTSLVCSQQRRLSESQYNRLRGDSNGFWLSCLTAAGIALVGALTTSFFDPALMTGGFDSEAALNNPDYLLSFVALLAFDFTLAGVPLAVISLWVLGNRIAHAPQESPLPTRTLQVCIDLPLKAVGRGQDPSYPVTLRASRSTTTGLLSPSWSLGAWTRVQTGPDRVPADLLRALGEELFDDLFQGEARRLYEQERTAAEGADEVFCLEITCEAPEPATWPWEALYDPHDGDFLSCANQVTITRHLPIRRRQTVALAPPLRILIIAASPCDSEIYALSPVNMEEEQTAMREALKVPLKQKLLDIQWRFGASQGAMRRPLLEMFRAEITRGYDIVHFVGHGGWDEYVGWVLYLEDEYGDAVPVGADELASAFRLAASDFKILQPHLPQLMVLNACLTAGGPGEGMAGRPTLSQSPGPSAPRPIKGGTGGLAAALVRAGVPFVVGMQLEIAMSSARHFSAAFYTTLASSRRVDHAVWAARQELAKTAGTNQADWLAPVLYAQSSDYVLFDPW